MRRSTNWSDISGFDAIEALEDPHFLLRVIAVNPDEPICLRTAARSA